MNQENPNENLPEMEDQEQNPDSPTKRPEKENPKKDREPAKNGPENREQPDKEIEEPKSREIPPEEEIARIVEKSDDLDRKIFEIKASAAETKREIGRLREGLGVPQTDEEPPSLKFKNERMEYLEERKEELRKEKEKWIEKYGKENLPKGLAVESGENERETNAGEAEEKFEDSETEEKEKKENLEKRKEWLEAWENDAIFHFETSWRKDWRTNDATNLELAVKVMKKRVVEAMNEKAKNFLEGEVDDCPFSIVQLHWEVSSILERLASKNPNYIKKIEIRFDKEKETIAEEKDLKKEEKENPEEEGKTEEPTDGESGENGQSNNGETKKDNNGSSGEEEGASSIG